MAAVEVRSSVLRWPAFPAQWRIPGLRVPEDGCTGGDGRSTGFAKGVDILRGSWGRDWVAMVSRYDFAGDTGPVRILHVSALELVAGQVFPEHACLLCSRREAELGGETASYPGGGGEM